MNIFLNRIIKTWHLFSMNTNFEHNYSVPLTVCLNLQMTSNANLHDNPIRIQMTSLDRKQFLSLRLVSPAACLLNLPVKYKFALINIFMMKLLKHELLGTPNPPDKSYHHTSILYTIIFGRRWRSFKNQVRAFKAERKQFSDLFNNQDHHFQANHYNFHR